MEKNLKVKNLRKGRENLEMSLGEYAGFIAFGIFTTNIIALNPGDLPGYIIGAFVFSILFMKIFNSLFSRLERLSLGFILTSLIAGSCASYGVIVAFKNAGLLLQINGILWLFLGIVIMKFNVDSILE